MGNSAVIYAGSACSAEPIRLACFVTCVVHKTLIYTMQSCQLKSPLTASD